MPPNIETRLSPNHAPRSDSVASIVEPRYEKPVVRLQKESASNDPLCGETVNVENELETWARDAFAPDGLGREKNSQPDAFVFRTGPEAPQFWSDPVLDEANLARARTIGELVAAGIMAVVAFGSWAHSRYQRWRLGAQTRMTLHELDDRQLRDIGFSREEISSVVAELIGTAERTRNRI